MKKLFITFIAIICVSLGVSAQNTGIGTTTPDTSAKLEISSTTKGFLTPRMTTVERDAIVSPAVGLWIYNTDTNTHNFFSSTMVWQEFSNIIPPLGSIATLDCAGANINGSLTNGVLANNVSAAISYSGGVQGSHTGQVVASTGVTGLTATLPTGSFVTGDGILTYTITGTPTSVGTASFAISIGGQVCTLSIPVNNSIASYTIGAGGACANTITTGVYTIGTNLDGTNTIRLDATVTIAGTWNIITNTVNGYYFIGSGIFSTTGIQQVTLTGVGVALSCGNNNFTITGDSGAGGSCITSISIGALPIVRWADRNLGAADIPTSAYSTWMGRGDTYQWGRGSDGHEKHGSAKTALNDTSNSDDPGHGNFILTNTGVRDWRIPQNDNLWQGVSGINNPCPSGYRVPTSNELDCERLSWDAPRGLNQAFAANRWTSNYMREEDTGGYMTFTNYWSSTIAGTKAYALGIYGSSSGMTPNDFRAIGLPVRCIKD